LTKQTRDSTRRDGKPPRNDGKHEGQPTPQGFKAAGLGNLHGVPPENSPGNSGLDFEPFDPDEGRPAKDPEAMAQRVFDQRRGSKAQGDAGPLAAAKRWEQDDDGQA
jgi:hypothetical protein